jgi:thiamine transport system permease protein
LKAGRKTTPGVWLIPLCFIGLFFFYPMVVILFTSFSRGGLDLSSWLLWTGIGHTIGFTVWQATLSTGLTFLVGMPAAYLFSHYKFSGSTTLRILTSLPFILPTVVAAAGFNALIGPRGVLNTMLQAIFQIESPPIQLLGTLGAILLAHVFYNVSIVIRLVGGAWSGLSHHPEQVARSLGANRWQVLWHVTLPLLRPAILSALVLVFLYDFTSFGVVLLLGGVNTATLEVEIYTQTVHLFNLPLAALLTIIQLGCTVLLTFIHRRLSRQSVPLAPVSEQENKRPARSVKQKYFVAVGGLNIVGIICLNQDSLISQNSVGYYDQH